MRAQIQFKGHGEHGVASPTPPRFVRPQPHRRKGRFHLVRRVDMDPVFRRKIVERQQPLAVLGQAIGRLGIFALVRHHKQVKGHLGLGTIRHLPDGLEPLLSLGLHALRQFVQNIGRFVHLTPLLARLTIDLAQGFPEKVPSPLARAGPYARPRPLRSSTNSFQPCSLSQ